MRPGLLAGVLVLIGGPGALASVPERPGTVTVSGAVPPVIRLAGPALRPARPTAPRPPAPPPAALRPAPPAAPPPATGPASPTHAPTSAPPGRDPARPTATPASSAPASTPVPAQPGIPGAGPGQPPGELSLRVTNDRDNLALGEPVRYVITLRNTSATPQRFTVRVTASAMLDDIQTGDRRAPDGVLAWPVVVPAHGESTMDFQARVENTYDDTNMMKVTACGQPDGAREPAVCASDLDDLMVRRASIAPALPWMAAGAALALLVGAAGWWWRRRAA